MDTRKILKQLTDAADLLTMLEHVLPGQGINDSTGLNSAVSYGGPASRGNTGYGATEPWQGTRLTLRRVRELVLQSCESVYLDGNQDEENNADQLAAPNGDEGVRLRAQHQPVEHQPVGPVSQREVTARDIPPREILISDAHPAVGRGNIRHPGVGHSPVRESRQVQNLAAQNFVPPGFAPQAIPVSRVALEQNVAREFGGSLAERIQRVPIPTGNDPTSSRGAEVSNVSGRIRDFHAPSLLGERARNRPGGVKGEE